MAFRHFLLGLVALTFLAFASAQGDCAFGPARFQIAQTYRVSDPPAIDASTPNYCLRLAGLDGNPDNIWLFSCSDPRSSAFIFLNAGNSTLRIYGTLIGGQLLNNSTLGNLTPFYLDFFYRNLMVEGQSLRIPFGDGNGGTFFDLAAGRSINLTSVRSDSTFELQPPSPGIVGKGQISIAGVPSTATSEIRVQFGACSECNCGIDQNQRLPEGFGFSGNPCNPLGCITVIVLTPSTAAPEITTPAATQATMAPTTMAPTMAPTTMAPTTMAPATTVPIGPAPTETQATPAPTEATPAPTETQATPAPTTMAPITMAPTTPAATQATPAQTVTKQTVTATKQTVIVAPAPTVEQTVIVAQTSTPVVVVPVNTISNKNAGELLHFNVFAILGAIAMVIASFH